VRERRVGCYSSRSRTRLVLLSDAVTLQDFAFRYRPGWRGRLLRIFATTRRLMPIFPRTALIRCAIVRAYTSVLHYDNRMDFNVIPAPERDADETVSCGIM